MTYLLISGSSRLGLAISSESSNSMHRDRVVDFKLSPKWQRIKRLQWPLEQLGFQSMHSMN